MSASLLDQLVEADIIAQQDGQIRTGPHHCGDLQNMRTVSERPLGLRPQPAQGRHPIEIVKRRDDRAFAACLRGAHEITENFQRADLDIHETCFRQKPCKKLTATVNGEIVCPTLKRMAYRGDEWT